VEEPWGSLACRKTPLFLSVQLQLLRPGWRRNSYWKYKINRLIGRVTWKYWLTDSSIAHLDMKFPFSKCRCSEQSLCFKEPRNRFPAWRIESLESIPGLLKRLQIGAPITIIGQPSTLHNEPCSVRFRNGNFKNICSLLVKKLVTKRT
jgi:hypothetical protein